MDLIEAKQSHFDIVKNIVHTTIDEIYPKYYPRGALSFFHDYHSDENIHSAIENKTVFLLKSGEDHVGTGSIVENEITRLFVLPQFQGRGYGSKILNELEDRLFEQYNEIVLYSSLAAYDLYIKRGYISLEYHKMQVDNGDFLCYHDMKKIKI